MANRIQIFWNRNKLLILVAVIFSVIGWGYYFWKTPQTQAERPAENEKLWHETLPEPAKKQPYTINVVPPPKVVGTVQSKGGK